MSALVLDKEGAGAGLTPAPSHLDKVLRGGAVWGAQLVVVMLCALALKFYYSTASADDLLWILAPTTLLVELLSGRSFSFESYTGYMSSDHTFVIAVPCAGVNFLITAFLMLALRRLWRDRLQGVSWWFLPVAGASAYVATLLVNTVRIVIALEMQRRSFEVNWLTANQLHRIEGIVVYFGFLMLLFLISERAKIRRPRRMWLFPLVVYYATTLGIPLLSGSYQKSDLFWEHFGFVIILPPIVLAFFGVIRGGPLTVYPFWKVLTQRRGDATEESESRKHAASLRRRLRIM